MPVALEAQSLTIGLAGKSLGIALLILLRVISNQSSEPWESTDLTGWREEG